MKTFSELKEELKRYDEVTLLEMLDISSEEIVDRFGDIIADRVPYVLKILDEETNEFSDYDAKGIDDLSTWTWEPDWDCGDDYE